MRWGVGDTIVLTVLVLFAGAVIFGITTDLREAAERVESNSPAITFMPLVSGDLCPSTGVASDGESTIYVYRGRIFDPERVDEEPPGDDFCRQMLMKEIEREVDDAD